jgi:broad specificity phosphatase PhoE
VTGPGAIYVVRHGETVWNVEGRRQGSLDSPLTPRGVEQAGAAGRALRHALGARRDVVLECSPLGRARRTAEILCRELGWPETAIVTQPLLAELRQGTWEGLTPPEIDVRYPGARAARERDKWNYVFPGGESYADVARRARAWLAARAPDADTIAVTHEMLSRTLVGAYAGLESDQMLELSHPHGRVVRLWGGAVGEAAA